MHGERLVATIGSTMIGGYVGTKLMERVSSTLYRLEPEDDRRREDAVRPGPPYQIAARKTAALLGLDLSDRTLQALGTYLFHYGLGMGWASLYPLLRSETTLRPLAAGLVTGGSLSLLVDEGLTPLLGFSAPNRAYPLITHLRGVANHLVYGLSVAVSVEALRRLGRQLNTA